MFKRLLVLVVGLSLVYGNVFSKPIPIEPLPTKYDKKQDIKIDKNTKDINKETDQRIREDIKLNNSIDDNTLDITDNKSYINDNTLDVTDNKSSINSNLTNISNNKNLINNNSNKITSLDNRVSELEEIQYIVGLEGRVYDSKKWQVNIFADYSTNRNKVDRTGVRFIYKFGSSFEEKEINKLKQKLEELENKLK